MGGASTPVFGGIGFLRGARGPFPKRGIRWVYRFTGGYRPIFGIDFPPGILRRVSERELADWSLGNYAAFVNTRGGAPPTLDRLHIDGAGPVGPCHLQSGFGIRRPVFPPPFRVIHFNRLQLAAEVVGRLADCVRVVVLDENHRLGPGRMTALGKGDAQDDVLGRTGERRPVHDVPLDVSQALGLGHNLQPDFFDLNDFLPLFSDLRQELAK